MMELLTTTLIMSFYVFVASFCLYFFAYKKGIEMPDEDNWDDEEWGGDWGDETKASSQTRNPLLKHWLDFGAGYYGTIAFVELMKIELRQLSTFISEWQGMDAFVGEFSLNSLISLFVSIMVEQFQNFVAAIIWPSRYLQQFSVFECAALVVVTYCAYKVAKKMASFYLSRRLQGKL